MEINCKGLLAFQEIDGFSKKKRRKYILHDVSLGTKVILGI